MESKQRGRPLSRAMLPIPHLRSPILRSLTALAVSLTAFALPHSLGWPATGDSSVALYVVGAVAAFAGVLVLFQSAAIIRIHTLRQDSKRLLDELARRVFYMEQVRAALDEVHEFRRNRDVDPFKLASGVLDTTGRRLSDVFDSSVCLYVVETTAQWHIVRASSGTTRFEIEVGKRCRGDRPLDEVLSGIGNYWHVAPVKFGGSSCGLVLLADQVPTEIERMLIDQLALVLGFASEQPARSRGSRRSTSHLRAVQ